ncbi:MAG: hypothetical protein WC364_06615 [Eubacteriales bacterium]
MKKLICARRHQRNFLFPSRKNSDKPGSNARGFSILKHLPIRYMPPPGERADYKLAVKLDQKENERPADELGADTSLTNETK